MDEINTWGNLFGTSLQQFWNTVAASLPSVLGAFFIFLLGWLIAWLISLMITKLLKVVNFDNLAEKINASEFLTKANVSLSPSKLIGKFVYWLIILIVLITASETMGWTAVSNEISKLVSYLPRLFVAIVFFIIGTYIASFIRDVILGTTSSLGISTGKFIASFVFYLLLITVTLTALNQAGVDTTIITSNLLLILGAILASAAISYGFASRDILSNVLAGFFSKNMYAIGMKIEVDGSIGTIDQMTNIGVVLKEENGNLIVIPTNTLINNKVKIFV